MCALARCEEVAGSRKRLSQTLHMHYPGEKVTKLLLNKQPWATNLQILTSLCLHSDKWSIDFSLNRFWVISATKSWQNLGSTTTAPAPLPAAAPLPVAMSPPDVTTPHLCPGCSTLKLHPPAENIRITSYSELQGRVWLPIYLSFCLFFFFFL